MCNIINNFNTFSELQEGKAYINDSEAINLKEGLYDLASHFQFYCNMKRISLKTHFDFNS